MQRLVLLPLLLAFAAPLSGCGIKGELTAPDPIWGEARAEVANEDDAEIEEGVVDGVGEDGEPLYGVDVID